VKFESELVLIPSVLKLSSGDDGIESLFRCEMPVVERSAPGYRIAPSHLIVCGTGAAPRSSTIF
jgi:hypothetical protein